MAAHRVRSRQHDSSGSGQRKCQEWRGYICHGSRLVWIWTSGGRDDRTASDDPERQTDPAVDGLA